MRTLLILALFLCFSISNQAQSSNFLRVFDPSGKKIAKGHLNGTTETSLILKKGNRTIEIPYQRIGHMITKRSFGHSVLMTSLLIGGITSTIGIVTNSSTKNTTSPVGGELNFNIDLSYSNTDILAMGLTTGVLLGTSVGGIIGGTKKTEHFNVNGNIEEWKKVKVILDMKIAKAGINK